jgi:hypothetical protein
MADTTIVIIMSMTKDAQDRHAEDHTPEVEGN